MRNRAQHREESEPFEPIEWPDDDLEVDDEAFARAIAEGRSHQRAA